MLFQEDVAAISQEWPSTRQNKRIKFMGLFAVESIGFWKIGDCMIIDFQSQVGKCV